MRNYEAVNQWASTVSAEKAFSEISKLKEKYPWLKCDESLQFIQKMQKDLPKIVNIIKLQEKQNAIQERVMAVNHMADEAIINAITAQYGIKL
jgi:hypothetical protein